MEDKYTLGVDYGSLSARSVLCRVSDGYIIAEREFAYPHGVMSETLPDGTPLPMDWALEHPQDYIDALYDTLGGVVRESGIKKEQIIAIGIDVTGSTPLPVDRNGNPLCFDKRFKSHRNAYIKLWKHHSATWEAEQLTDFCRERDPELLISWGGRLNAESMLTKLWQVLREDPEVYEAMDRYLEAGVWLTHLLTGERENISLSMAVHKTGYRAEKGYPVFFEELDPGLKGMYEKKLRGRLVKLGDSMGKLLPEMAEKLGLCPGIPVVCPQYDGLAALPAVGITGSEAAMFAAGTSGAMMICTEKLCPVEGACSIAKDLILPDVYGYASGQAGFGDLLAWYVKNGAPKEVYEAAERKKISVHQELTERAAELRPGESGLLALDWWNGNKTVLEDMRLSGLMLGMTLQTRPGEIYRALLEALAFGVRCIVEAHRKAGADIKVLHMTGGISWKNPLMMQILSSVTHLPLKIAAPCPAPAIGMAMFAAKAAGKAAGGYDSLNEAIEKMNCLTDKTYEPNPADYPVYDALYSEFVRLHDYFGRGGNNVMHTLRNIASRN